MSSSQNKEEIRELIKKRIVETKKSIESLTEQSKPVAPDNAIGRITRMDAIGQRSLQEANLRAAEERLYQLEEALEHIDDEGFGLCSRCQQPIPIERVLVMPESRLCVNCASR